MVFRHAVTKWIGDLQTKFSIGVHDIAARSGVRSSTIYRWLDDDLLHIPSHASVLKIATAFGVAAPILTSGTGLQIQGFAETGLAPTDTPEGEDELTINQSWWTVRDRALDLAGFLLGDRILLDQAQPPRAGDAVIAQVYGTEQTNRLSAETRLLLYEPPFLVTRSTDPTQTLKPLLVDNERVVVMGPIIRLVRDRGA